MSETPTEVPERTLKSKQLSLATLILLMTITATSISALLDKSEKIYFKKKLGESRHEEQKLKVRLQSAEQDLQKAKEALNTMKQRSSPLAGNSQ